MCFGDSLTASSVNKNSVRSSIAGLIKGDKSYPGRLQELLGDEFQIYNCGVGGENTTTIMARQGCAPLVLAHDVTIFATTDSKYKLHLGNCDLPAFKSSYNDSIVLPLLQNTNFLNPVKINGKEFEITSESNIICHETADGKRNYEFEYNYYLKPLFDVKETITLKKGSLVETSASRLFKKPYALILFMGENGGYSNNSDLIDQYRKMIDYAACDRYIVISFHKPNAVTKNIPMMEVMEDSLHEAFGDHYINLRKEVISQSSHILGSAITAGDKDSIRAGQVPPSLLRDGIHFTPDGYELISRIVYDRLKRL